MDWTRFSNPSPSVNRRHVEALVREVEEQIRGSALIDETPREYVRAGGLYEADEELWRDLAQRAGVPAPSIEERRAVRNMIVRGSIWPAEWER